MQLGTMMWLPMDQAAPDYRELVFLRSIALSRCLRRALTQPGAAGMDVPMLSQAGIALSRRIDPAQSNTLQRIGLHGLPVKRRRAPGGQLRACRGDRRGNRPARDHQAGTGERCRTKRGNLNFGEWAEGVRFHVGLKCESGMDGGVSQIGAQLLTS